MIKQLLLQFCKETRESYHRDSFTFWGWVGTLKAIGGLPTVHSIADVWLWRMLVVTRSSFRLFQTQHWRHQPLPPFPDWTDRIRFSFSVPLVPLKGVQTWWNKWYWAKALSYLHSQGSILAEKTNRLWLWSTVSQFTIYISFYWGICLTSLVSQVTVRPLIK